ncbi:MAG: hypothetical protein ACI89X_004566 [Planctomycetota bacterium]|jgi:hypothetical protein
MAYRYNVAHMIRLSVRSIGAVLVVGCVVGGGCATPEPAPKRAPDSAVKPDLSYLQKQFEDQTPQFVAPGSLDSVVLIHDDQTRTIGSGTVIAPDRVLTAAHVVSGLTRDDRGRLSIRIDGEAVTAVVESAGDPELPHGDWAILAFERAHWIRVAAVYEATRDHRWVPDIDTEVLLVGFAAGFYPTMNIDVRAPTPCVRVRIRETGERQPAWYAIGDALDLSGMSGGAAMIWNYQTGRPELIGVFRGYVQTETVTTEQTRIAGVSTSVRETKKPGIAFMIHRLPAIIRNPEAAGQSR